MLTENEKQVLNLLRKDSRLSAAEIARQLALPPTTVTEIVKRLKHKGIVVKYSILPNMTELGYGFRVQISTRSKVLPNIFAKSKSVNCLYKTIDGYLADVIVSNMAEYEKFREELSIQVEMFEEHHIIEAIQLEVFPVN